jgi:uncharacterized membrane protein YqjE
MDHDEKDMLEANGRLMLRIFKALLYTVLIVLFSVYGIHTLLILLIRNADDITLLGSLIIGCIFTVIYCTIIILEKGKSKS